MDEQDSVAKEPLSQNEDQFFKAFAEAPIGMALATPTGQIVEVNQAYLDMLGYSREQLLHHTSDPFTHPGDIEKTRLFFQQLTRGASHKATMEKRYIRKNGQILWARASAAMRTNQHGQATQLIAIIEDISEQKRAEAALEENEARLRLSQAAGRVGSFDWRMDRGIILWSPTMEDLYGLAEGTFAGTMEDWAARIDPEDYPKFEVALKECIAKREESYSCELRAILPNGDRRWLRAQGMLSYTDLGTPIRMAGVNIDINDQKLAEAQLQRQWQNFDIALSNSPDFTYVFDLAGRFTYANSSLLSLWGKPLEEIIGKRFFELDYSPDLAARLDNQVREVVRSGVKIRDQASYAGLSGETRIYDYIFAPVFSSDGRVEAVVGNTRDVTERNKAEELMAEDRRRWRELLLQTPAAIAILTGPDHRLEWVNNDYVNLVARRAEDLIGKPVRQALPEIADQDFIQLLDNVLRTGQPFEGHEVLARLKNARGVLTDYFLNFVFLLTRNSSGAVNGIFVHATNVTEALLARKQLEENERQFRTLAETIPHLAWMADESGYIFWYNRRWFDYTGTTLEDMQGWGWQSVHDPKMVDEVTAEWQQALRSGSAFEMIFPLKGADGVFRSFLTRVEPVRDSNGKVVRWFGTNTDITEQRRIEAQLRRSNRELEEFAYVASHDLQEPLRMVSIYTHQILKQLETDDPTLHQYAEFVRKGVGRMQSLIQDLLSFSLAVHTEAQPAGQAHLSTSLLEAISLLSNRIEETGAQVNRPPLPIVQGDTLQLAQVFMNLISNAIKYRGAASPVVEIGARREGNSWIISVRDNGIGFEQQYAERIFGLFKRLHKDEYPGTGLGLAICKRIVERYGGQIWAESTLGLGATFYFSLLDAKSV